MRDPRRATNIGDIRFVLNQPDGLLDRILTPREPAEPFWASLEEALRLLTRVKRVRLRLPQRSASSASLGRLVDILSSVFKQSCVTRLDARLPTKRLLQLCQAWPSLTTLSAEDAYRIPLAGLLPQLRHVRFDRDSLIHIVPERPIETVYHDEPLLGGDGDLDALKRLQAALQICKTLRKARLYCNAHFDVTDFLTGFTHDNLRELYLFVELKESVHWDEPALTLASGVPQGFPKLEYFQTMLFHPDFLAFDIDRAGSKQVNAIVEGLSAFLRSEDHSTLKGIELGLCGWANHYRQCRRGIRFVATRYGNLWDVDVVDRDWSVMPEFDDML